MFLLLSAGVACLPVKRRPDAGEAAMWLFSRREEAPSPLKTGRVCRLARVGVNGCGIQGLMEATCNELQQDRETVL